MSQETIMLVACIATVLGTLGYVLFSRVPGEKLISTRVFTKRNGRRMYKGEHKRY